MHRKWPVTAFIPCLWYLSSMGLKDSSWTLQSMNTPEYPGWDWAPGDLILAPQIDLQQLRTSLHCSVLALNNWIDWRNSLNSQSYCGCHPVFIFLSSSLIKSPAVGLGKINQHFIIYSCFHEVLSITSNMYFMVLLFSFALSLYKTQCWGKEHQPMSECKQLQGLGGQDAVLDLYLYLWMEISGLYEDNKDLGCLSSLVLIKLIERRRPKALTFVQPVNTAWIQ